MTYALIFMVLIGERLTVLPAVSFWSQEACEHEAGELFKKVNNAILVDDIKNRPVMVWKCVNKDWHGND